ncbi:hypothetical protein HJG60_008842 [Phyllostomus discolor]|uniref:Uncharacterized protein n=1 Tax=Phyllostomus discolor TaxID=89673 RepID=A0A834DFY5_9CHIR|nr:hypothetical protein HJG60_008842 [Phyllostomus discolor]
MWNIFLCLLILFHSLCGFLYSRWTRCSFQAHGLDPLGQGSLSCSPTPDLCCLSNIPAFPSSPLHFHGSPQLRICQDLSASLTGEYQHIDLGCLKAKSSGSSCLNMYGAVRLQVLTSLARQSGNIPWVAVAKGGAPGESTGVDKIRFTVIIQISAIIMSK